MTAPLTPSDCDLRGLTYMPLDVQRLRDSDLALISTGDEFKAAVLLWSVSWAQVPAASLPDDDRLLAALVHLDPKAWKKVRGVAMRGWVKCSDGRLYHPVVAEKACDAWKDRTKYREKREKDRARLEAWREAQKQPGEQPGNGDGNDVETRFETRCETQPEEKGTGSGGIKEPPIPPNGGASDLAFEQAWKAYPPAGRSTIAKPLGRKVWDDTVAGGVEPARLLSAVQAVAASDYARSGGKPVRFDRWLEKGLFANHDDGGSSAEPFNWPGPPDVWALALDRKGEPWARGYIGRCAWRDGALVCASPTLAKGIREALGRDLDGLGYRLVEGSPTPSETVRAA